MRLRVPLLGGRHKELERHSVVLRHAHPVHVHVAQPVASAGKAQIVRLVEPVQRRHVVLLGCQAVRVHVPKHAHGVRVLALGRLMEPGQRRLEVLQKPPRAPVVQVPHRQLGPRVALGGGVVIILNDFLVLPPARLLPVLGRLRQPDPLEPARALRLLRLLDHLLRRRVVIRERRVARLGHPEPVHVLVAERH